MTTRNIQCPNCGSMLHAWQRGERSQKCQFCGLDVLVERTTERPAALPAEPRVIVRNIGAGGGSKAGTIIATVVATVVIGVGLLAYLVLRNIKQSHVASDGSQGSLDKVGADGRSYAKGAGVLGRFGGPAALDIDELARHALSTARKVYPDAQLYRISAQMVRPSGLVDLTLEDRGPWFDLRSPAQSHPATPEVLGHEDVVKCWYQLTASIDSVSSWPRDSTRHDCMVPVVTPPTCTLAEIWQRALADGAPGNAVATLYYSSIHHQAYFFREPMAGIDPDVPSPGLWEFSIDAEPRFAKSYPDDCAAK
ncbi:MAG: hypothetical protein IT370_15990 [Deltaproteobacteria bacterium]|nr:hypothetical protein [Deltaproteobacteria bacterium]